MKKALIVTDWLGCDGASKSLVSLLGCIDYEILNIDLMLLDNRDDFFRPMIPDEVRVVDPPEDIDAYLSPLHAAVWRLLSLGRISLLSLRIYQAILIRLACNPTGMIQRVWIRAVPHLDRLSEGYDVIISYQDIWSAYYVALRGTASIKISWNHNDYVRTGRIPRIDAVMMKHLSYLVTVSEERRKQLSINLPDFQQKIRVLPNILSPRLINKMSGIIGGFEDDFQGYRILTIGRLDYQKGIDIAIDACKTLIDRGLKIRWYVLGFGNPAVYRNKLDHLEPKDSFVFLGTKTNPYPYIKQCDVYVQPSRSEGFGLALAEARILKKPCVVSDIDVFCKQIEHNHNGLVSPLDPINIADNVQKILLNTEIQDRFARNLAKERIGNEYVVGEFYKLLGVS